MDHIKETIINEFAIQLKATDLSIINLCQKIVLAFIQSSFFPWVFLVLVINRKNWKRPVIFILIAHWILRSIGDICSLCINFGHKEKDKMWPYSNFNWNLEITAHFFWELGEIVGDWYPLMRTRAITNNKKRIKMVYITCILYNITKAMSFGCYFIEFPMDLTTGSSSMGRFNSYWWGCVAIMQVVSFCYDLSVIVSLRQNLFSQVNYYQSTEKNHFIEKFKKISEYRIILSMVSTLIFFPFLIFYVLVALRICNKNLQECAYNKIMEYTSIEQFRQVVLSINFTLMYIDQILLRRFVKQNQQEKKEENQKNKYSLSNYNPSSMNSTFSEPLLSLSASSHLPLISENTSTISKSMEDSRKHSLRSMEDSYKDTLKIIEENYKNSIYYNSNKNQFPSYTSTSPTGNLSDYSPTDFSHYYNYYSASKRKGSNTAEETSYSNNYSSSVRPMDRRRKSSLKSMEDPSYSNTYKSSMRPMDNRRKPSLKSMEDPSYSNTYKSSMRPMDNRRNPSLRNTEDPFKSIEDNYKNTIYYNSNKNPRYTKSSGNYNDYNDYQNNEPTSNSSHNVANIKTYDYYDY